MKRPVLQSLLLLAGFAAGWTAQTYFLGKRMNEFNQRENTHIEERFHDSNIELCKGIYGPNRFHLKDRDPQVAAQLAAFDPAKSNGSITLSYLGGADGSDHHIRLSGDGALSVEDHGKTQLAIGIDSVRGRVLFERTLTSGILNWSEGVIELKELLLMRYRNIRGTGPGAPTTQIHIVVPELGIDQVISTYGNAVALKEIPEIIEVQLANQVEKEILDLVPRDAPPWK